MLLATQSITDKQQFELCKTCITQRRFQMFIDYETLIIIILITFMIGFMIGVRFTRPRYDRYDR